MIKIENVEVVGFEHAIRGMRNPMNSWAKSDSGYCENLNVQFLNIGLNNNWAIGESDHKLMMNLCKAGTDHRKFMRMIICYADIVAPRYWWTEFDTYRFGVEKNSCSTMHKIAEKEFTLEDFSDEHISSKTSEEGMDGVGIRPWMADEYYGEWSPYTILDTVVDMLNACRDKYLETKDMKFWWQMIQLLPQSYNQRRTVMMSYEALANMYHARKAHKLDEWRNFCGWAKTLPYAELITGEEK